MKPYYEHAGITIYCGDCRDFATTDAVDVVIADPPYGDTSLDWDVRVEGWTNAMELVLANSGSMWVHELVVQFYRGEWARIFKNPIKEKAVEGKRVIRARRPPHFGHIEQSAYRRERGGEVLMQSVIDVPNCHGYAEHPTQKPTGIIDPLLRYSCPPSGRVVVPFSGAGSELLQAKRLGLRAIGIEIEEKYCEIAAKRLSQEVLQFKSDG